MPSLYEFTTPVGDVASGDFTTLYNASGLTVPNAGAGSVSGNLNVGGNLTVQGSSLLIGPVALQNTLSLPNFTFPSNDGTTYQVLATDGSGNLYWTNVQAIPGATYAIQADTATGGANLSLVSAFTTDSVKFAGGTNITVSRTDASTITISSSADDIPDGTAQGQLLVWDGSAWTANSLVTSLTVADRFIAELKNNTATTSVVSSFRRNFGSTAYSTGFGSVIGFQFDSDSQAAVTVGSIGYTYDAANPSFEAFTSTDNFVTRTQISKINSTNVEFNGTNLYLNANHTGAPSANATINVERGSSTDATLTWNETADQWEFTNDLFAQGNYGQNGQSISINADSTAADSFLYLKGNSKYLTWNNTLSRFEFNDSLFSSTTAEPPAQFERKVTTAEINNPLESKSALRLTERVTDAVSNATDQGGPGIVFSRASGTTPGSTEALYANISSVYYGTTNTADTAIYWSNDSFSEPTPGTFPGTYRLFRAGSNDSEFLNDSLFINYSAPGTTKTATSITGGNTLVFGSAHGFTSGQRIQFTSATQNGLTQNSYYYVLAAGLTATECRLGLTSTGSAVALTNGTGLTLNFVNLVNRVGVNTATPAYTLDVNGDAHVDTDLTVDGDIYISGYQVDINSPVKGDLILFDGTKFVNDNVVQFDSAAARTRFQSNIAAASGTIQSGLIAVKNTGATNYTTGDGSGVLIAVDDDTNPINIFAGLSAAYSSTGNHEARLRSSTDAFATVDKNLLAVNDNDLKVRATEFIMNAEGSAALAVDAQVTVERGTSGADSYLKWAESNGRWEFSNTLAVGGDLRASDDLYLNTNQNAADVNIYFGTAASATAKTLRFDVSTDLFYFSDTLSVEGTVLASANVVLNRDYSDNNAIIAFRKPTSGEETIQWNKTIGRFELTTDMYVPQATIGNIDIDRTNGTITTNTGNLTIDSAGGTVAINDNLNVDSGVLYVDAANNRVGVNTVTPSVDLQVGGTIWGNSVIAINGDLGTNGENIYFNYDDGGSGADSYLTVRRGTNPDVSIRWNESTDRWQTTTDGTNYLNIPNQNLDTTDDVTFASVTVDGGHTVIDTTTTTTTSTAQTAITSTSNATTRSSKFQIQITDNVTGNIHVLEAMMFFQGTTAYLTTYAEMYNSTSLATFAADVNGGNTRLLATPASANNTTFKVTRISVAL
jgi:hypothetical protein